MNLNYSYSAFLIATLLVGNLILMMYIVELSNNKKVDEKLYELEYVQEEILIEELDLALLSAKNLKIETHKAYNEAEKFIADIENERIELLENTEDKLAEMNDAIESLNSKIIIINIDKSNAVNNKNKTVSLNNSNNRNSTNTYHLLDRKALYFPNPVYTCDSFGKVVLHITVSNLGNVINTSFNKNASTTSNVCLIENAIIYAKKARFTIAENKPKQLGSITYIFPGQ